MHLIEGWKGERTGQAPLVMVIVVVLVPGRVDSVKRVSWVRKVSRVSRVRRINRVRGLAGSVG
jgi:hypothetical protein